MNFHNNPLQYIRKVSKLQKYESTSVGTFSRAPAINLINVNNSRNEHEQRKFHSEKEKILLRVLRKVRRDRSIRLVDGNGYIDTTLTRR